MFSSLWFPPGEFSISGSNVVGWCFFSSFSFLDVVSRFCTVFVFSLALLPPPFAPCLYFLPRISLSHQLFSPSRKAVLPPVRATLSMSSLYFLSLLHMGRDTFLERVFSDRPTFSSLFFSVWSSLPLNTIAPPPPHASHPPRLFPSHDLFTTALFVITEPFWSSPEPISSWIFTFIWPPF